jgi:hypothetical protein
MMREFEIGELTNARRWQYVRFWGQKCKGLVPFWLNDYATFAVLLQQVTPKLSLFC